MVDESGLCEKYAADIDVLVGLHSTKPIEINVMFMFAFKKMINVFEINIGINNFQVDGLTKEQRKSIHTFLKFKYGKAISTSTEKDQDKQFIVISLSTLVKDG